MVHSRPRLTAEQVREVLNMGLGAGPDLARTSHCKFETNQLVVVGYISLFGDGPPQGASSSKTQKLRINAAAVEHVSAR